MGTGLAVSAGCCCAGGKGEAYGPRAFWLGAPSSTPSRPGGCWGTRWMQTGGHGAGGAERWAGGGRSRKGAAARPGGRATAAR